jgi:hypothetical protein
MAGGGWAAAAAPPAAGRRLGSQGEERVWLDTMLGI